ncbi:hypothetical protein A4A49_31747 [Nicotiana attenuata]|uniref:Uncharacterized protein n=1 Tax=Nicotiana attenuata TaxID=49451 RepID=A0A314KL75_NICAT|nr:hypothetical protein A4A49_31747 [Nicotiana attenuata]
MARTLQYFAIFFLLRLLLSSIYLLHVTEARPVMVKNSGNPFGVMKNSGPSPGIGHRFENSGISVEDIDVVHSGPSPGEGHK